MLQGQLLKEQKIVPGTTKPEFKLALDRNKHNNISRVGDIYFWLLAVPQQNIFLSLRDIPPRFTDHICVGSRLTSLPGPAGEQLQTFKEWDHHISVASDWIWIGSLDLVGSPIIIKLLRKRHAFSPQVIRLLRFKCHLLVTDFCHFLERIWE